MENTFTIPMEHYDMFFVDPGPHEDLIDKELLCLLDVSQMSSYEFFKKQAARRCLSFSNSLVHIYVSSSIAPVMRNMTIDIPYNFNGISMTVRGNSSDLVYLRLCV